MDLPTSGYEEIDMMLTSAEGSMSMDSPFSASYAAFQGWFPSDTVGGLGALTGDADACTGDQSDTAPKSFEGSLAAATTSSSAPTRHDCTQETKDLMRRLYCANPSDPISDGVAARTLDLGSVLTRNRDVVGRLGLLLKCPCARLPHMAMLYASVISRVLLWYRQAAWNPGPSPAASPSNFSPTSFSQVSQEATPPLSSCGTLKPFDLSGPDDNGGVSVLLAPVTVGAFQSDDISLQTAVTNRLILSELKKTRALIESFIELGSATSESQSGAEACPAAPKFSTTVADAGLFASLGASLRSEYERVEWKARSALSVLDETNNV
jgi:hypothetical protein